MSNSILSNSAVILQSISDFMDGDRMKERAFKSFLDDLIMENAQRNADYFSLFASDLEHHERKLFLSYLVSPELFAELTENLYREIEALKEFEPDMQKCIDERIDAVYFDYMQEMRDDPDGQSCLMSLTSIQGRNL